MQHVIFRGPTMYRFFRHPLQYSLALPLPAFWQSDVPHIWHATTSDFVRHMRPN
jgi:hypothetical protein